MDDTDELLYDNIGNVAVDYGITNWKLRVVSLRFITSDPSLVNFSLSDSPSDTSVLAPCKAEVE